MRSRVVFKRNKIIFEIQHLIYKPYLTVIFFERMNRNLMYEMPQNNNRKQQTSVDIYLLVNK